MPDSREIIIEAAVSAIKGDDELRLGARRQVGALLDTEGQIPDDDANEMLRRWKEVHGPGRFRHCAAVLWVAVAVSVTTAAWTSIPHFLWYEHNFINFGYLPELRNEAHAYYGGKAFSQEQNVMLFEKPGAKGIYPERKQLWETNPENPAYLAEYAMGWKSNTDESGLPPGFSEAASRIDPSNSYFAYWIAAAKAKGTVKMTPARKTGEADTWQILDPVALDEALTLAMMAGNMSRYETYGSAMAQRRLSLLGQGGGIREHFYRSVVMMGPRAFAGDRDLSKAYLAKASQLAQEGKREEFTTLTASMEVFSKSLVQGSQTLLDYVVVRGLVASHYLEFARAASALGMEQEAARLGRFAQKIKELGKAAMAARENPIYETRGADHTRVMGSLARRLAVNPPEVTTADLAPGSYHDHALASRVLAIAAIVIFGLFTGLLSSARFVSPKLVRRLAGRIACLLGPADHGWIVALGLFAPLLAITAISRLTPLGARDFSVGESTLWLLPTAHFVGLVLLVPATAILTARWRLRKRASLFGMGGNTPLAAVAVIALATAGMLLAGYPAVRQQWMQSSLYLAAVPFAIASLILMGMAARGLHASIRGSVESAVGAKILISVFGCAILAMAILIPLLEWEEQYWFDRFTFMQQDFQSAPLSKYEAALTSTAKAELLDALERP